MADTFLSSIEKRRSVYGLSSDIEISKDRIIEIVQHSIKHAPSAFNSQTARAVILFGEHHEKLWNIVKESLRRIVPEINFAQTENKINSFKAGAGTVLFFEDQSVIQGLKKQFALYADKFPVFSLQSSGMAQFAVWTALANEGVGGSLQHYNPIIDDAVKKVWNITEDWLLLSQLVFGKTIVNPEEKTFKPIENRVKIFI